MSLRKNKGLRIRERPSLPSFLSFFAMGYVRGSECVSEGEGSGGRKKKKKAIWADCVTLEESEGRGVDVWAKGSLVLRVCLMWMEMEMRISCNECLSRESARRGRGRGTACIGHTHIQRHHHPRR
jgi:hypothetical protein